MEGLEKKRDAAFKWVRDDLNAEMEFRDERDSYGDADMSQRIYAALSILGNVAEKKAHDPNELDDCDICGDPAHDPVMLDDKFLCDDCYNLTLE